MKSDMSAPRATQTKSRSSQPAIARLASPSLPQQKVVLTPAQWVRAVQGIETPFGQDRMPTVFG